MAAKFSLHDSADDEDYIDMELGSSPSNTISCCSTNSSPQSKEFEFQKSLTSNDKQTTTTTSPADELFYKGKLLPLLLPPRRQMLEILLRPSPATAVFDRTKEPFGEDHVYYSVPLTAPCTNTANTPLDSCNISPSDSCRVSCELNPDDCSFEWSADLSSFVDNHKTKKTFLLKKMKMIKDSVLGLKLKASRAYLKSLFSKSDDESSVKREKLPKDGKFSTNSVNKESLGYIGRDSYPTIAAIMRNIDKEGNEDMNVHRRSFSGAIKRHSPIKCLSSSSSESSSSSSSSFSVHSNGLNEVNCSRRSSSATEIEGSIEAAIAHCKKSQQFLDSRKSSRELPICSL